VSWRDQLRPASFRGVPFFVDSAETQVGRRTQTHEYPLRDRPYVEDLGLRTRTFAVEALVLGDAVFAARDRLLAAIDAPGPGVLVHPWLGERTVVCTESRLREATGEGGVARFTLTFTEAGINALPAATIDTRARVAIAADAALDECERAFAQSFDIKGQPDFVAAEARALLAPSATSGAIAPSNLRRVSGTRDPIKGKTPNLFQGLERQAGRVPTDATATGAWREQVKRDSARMPELMADPTSLGSTITSRIGGLSLLPAAAADPRSGTGMQRVSLMTGGTTTAAPRLSTRGLTGDKLANPAASFDLVSAFGDFGTGARGVPTSTPARLQQATNQGAITSLVRRTSFLESARAASGLDFTARGDALLLQRKIVERCEQVLIDEAQAQVRREVRAVQQRVNQAIVDARTAVVRDLQERAAQLPEVVRVGVRRAVPVVLLAHRIYGDAARAAEIEARNGIRHPLVTPGGRAIEVLS
jgi:prophage DNA circulation protein